MKKTIIKYFTAIFGVFIITFVFNLIFFKNNIISGDILGLSIIIDKYTKIDMFQFVIILYILIVAICSIFLKIKTIKRALLPTLLLPIFLIINYFFTYNLTISDIDLFLLVIAGAFFIGIGYGFIYKEGFLLGGTDLIARVINKYLSSNLVYTRLILNGIIVLCGTPFFGVEKTVYGLLAIIIIHNISSKLLRGEDNKTFYIITSKHEEIKHLFIKEEKYDITIFDVEGGHKNKKRKMIMCVIKSTDYYRLKKVIEELDKDAFITVTDSYEIMNQNKSIAK